MVRFNPTVPSEMFVQRYALPGSVYSDPGRDNGLEEIYPYGLYRVLKSIYQRTRGNKPVYITENGLRDAADSRRPEALLEHLAMMHRAISEGIPVRGYLHWTLVDDFNWTEGWGAHLGLIAMDPVTQERTPRRSSSLFGEICRANAITEEIVECYAPQVMDRVFRRP
jgi:beta-glucosidase